MYSHDKFVLDVRVTFTKRVPSWLETLAVSTPGGVELNEDILRVVKNDFIEGLPNYDVYRFIL